MNKILVTGANGFVGRAFCAEMKRWEYSLIEAVRGPAADHQISIGMIGPDTAWRSALQECAVVVHLAARVHEIHDQSKDPLAAFRCVNTAGTLNLAHQAAQSGVRRFVFMSSVKVNGEATAAMAFTEANVSHPQEPYALSKWEAEQGLWKIAAETGMEVVILRPPLVYGPEVKANFLKLLNWVERGIPLPVKAVQNRRSMIYLGNLVDALMLAAMHPAAAGKLWLVSDGEDVSTSELIRLIAQAMQKPAWLWSMPPAWLRLAGRLVGKSSVVERLLGSLQVDSSLIRRELGWVPPYSMVQGIANTVRWYRAVHGE